MVREWPDILPVPTSAVNFVERLRIIGAIYDATHRRQRSATNWQPAHRVPSGIGTLEWPRGGHLDHRRPVRLHCRADPPLPGHGAAIVNTVIATLTSSFNGGAQTLPAHVRRDRGLVAQRLPRGRDHGQAPGTVPNNGTMMTLGLRITANAGSKVVRLVKWHVAAV